MVDEEADEKELMEVTLDTVGSPCCPLKSGRTGDDIMGKSLQDHPGGPLVGQDH